MTFEEKKFYITLAALISPYILYGINSGYNKYRERRNQQKLMKFIKLIHTESLINVEYFADMYEQMYNDLQNIDKQVGFSTFAIDFKRILNLDNQVLWDLFIVNKKPYTKRIGYKNKDGSIARIETHTSESDLFAYLQMIHAITMEIEEHDRTKKDMQEKLAAITDHYHHNITLIKKAEGIFNVYGNANKESAFYKTLFNQYSKLWLAENEAIQNEKKRVDELQKLNPYEQPLDNYSTIGSKFMHEKFDCIKAGGFAEIKEVIELRHLLYDGVNSYANLATVRTNTAKQYKRKAYELGEKVMYAREYFNRLYNADDKFPPIDLD